MIGAVGPSREECMLALAPLVESAPVAAFFVQRDVSGELVIVGHNAAAVSLDPEIALRIGRRRAELTGWSAELLALAEGVWGDEVLVHAFTPSEAEGGDGRTLRATLLEPVPGVVLAWVEDRTALEAQRAESEEAQRTMALGRRARALAADLEDLLTTIAGAASGADVLSTDPAVRDELETIRAAAGRAGALVADLLGTPDAPTSQLFECSLDDVAAGLATELDAPPGALRSRVEQHASEWRACLDLGALQHFLGEIGRTALARAPRGALVYALDTVQVGVEGLPDDPAAASGEFLRIRVWDESPRGEATIAACGFDALFHAGTTERAPSRPAEGGDALALAGGYARIRQVGGHVRTTADDAGRSMLAVYLPRAPRLGPASLPPFDGATLRPAPPVDEEPDTERPTDRPPPPTFTQRPLSLPPQFGFDRPTVPTPAVPTLRPSLPPRASLPPRPSLLPPRTTRLPPRTTLLPRASRPPASRTSRPPAPMTRRTERVLVAEDEQLVRNVVVRTLRAAGFEVVAAVSGDAALALALADTAGFDLLVSDMQMPGLDGRRLAAELRTRQPTLRVLFMSGYSDGAFEGEPMGEGASFVAKPFTARELAAAARRALDG
jgi:CheY-like chemotaxis protein